MGDIKSYSTSNMGSSSYKAVARSGSSYISEYSGCKTNILEFTEMEMQSGYHKGSSELEIRVTFLCSSNCESCASYTVCTKCFSVYNLFHHACVIKCLEGYVGAKGICEMCKTCKNSRLECISFLPNFFLHNKPFLSSCPEKFIGVNVKCELCLEPCSKCQSDKFICTSCTNDYHLLKNICYSLCPSKYILNLMENVKHLVILVILV